MPLPTRGPPLRPQEVISTWGMEPSGRIWISLGHGLAAEAGAVGLAVVEDVPLLPNLHHAAVVVAAVVHGLVRGL